MTCTLTPWPQAHACAAVVNFSEGADQELMQPHLDTLISKLLVLLQHGKKLVQEGALTAMASVADCSQVCQAQAAGQLGTGAEGGGAVGQPAKAKGNGAGRVVWVCTSQGGGLGQAGLHLCRLWAGAQGWSSRRESKSRAPGRPWPAAHPTLRSTALLNCLPSRAVAVCQVL